ncbi:MAG TPA: c-type cytochrome biogenesis protein CcsB [Peptococcaceae bacterium]|nr:c-type cytochrome biogenesis protein CcsB [Peptococcaceae bacterium]
MEIGLNFAVFICILISIIISTVALWKAGKNIEKIAFGLLVLAFFLLTASLSVRSFNLGRLPFANLYEYTFVFVWGILLLYALSRSKLHSALFTLLVAFLTFVLLSFGSTMPSEAKPLLPALQSYWLRLHVGTAIISYSAFALSFCLAIMYLIKEKAKGADFPGILPPLEKLDKLQHLAIIVGFSFLSLVLITGAIWAEEVWGKWWSWDPKETWALITWLIYAAYLHCRQRRNWKGKKASILAIVGFLVVLFTLYGVSFLMSGYHSYI